MINSNVTTITLSGSETAVEFEKGYPYYQINNNGDSAIYVSMLPNIIPKAEGVYLIPVGGVETFGGGYPFNKFYVLGTGEAQISGKNIAMPTSFRVVLKGGDQQKGSKYLIVDVLPEAGSEKYTYLVPVSDFLSDNKYDEYIWVNGEWEKVGTPTINISIDYNDLINKPTIDIALSDTSTNAVQNKVITAALADKQDLLTKEPIFNNDIDWNTLVETAAYPVGLDWLSEDNTHGLGGIYGFGFLTILARRNYNGWVYQIYINDHREVYMRTFYRNWSLWERIDAGRPATASQIGGVKSGGDISVAANGTVSVSKSITINPSSPVTMKEFKQLIFSTIKQNGYGRTYIFKTDMSVITSHWDDDDAVIAFFGNTLTAMPLAIVVNYITLLLSSTGAEAVYIVKTITDSDEPQWSELKTIIN